MNEISHIEYSNLLTDIVDNIEKAKIKASKMLNSTLIELYYNNGKMIVERQLQFGWGQSVIKRLSDDLNKTYDGLTGYSISNLQYMRQFYLEYKDNPVLLSYALNIPWGQNLLILQKTVDLEEREYYLKATDNLSWSRAVLLNQIKANAYQYQLKNPKATNFNETLPEHLAEQANESLKSSYNLEFLGITKPVLERKMENMLVAKIRDFLIELGYGFAFIGNQYKLQLGDDEYFIDLLFYHRKLKCLVAIELKTVKFQPEFVSKMNFYLEILDETVKEPDENSSIGIILCAEKNNLTVEYALRTTNRPIGVAEYELTKALKNKLPSPDEIKKQLIMIKENNANLW